MAEPFRLLITGSRRCTPEQERFIVQRLDSVYYSVTVHRPLIVVQGECPHGGVDLVAKRWAESMRVACEGHPADWARYGKAAGPRRNAHMVSLGADLIMAFPDTGSRGTWDCLAKAVDAGIEPRLYPLNLVDGQGAA